MNNIYCKWTEPCKNLMYVGFPACMRVIGWENSLPTYFLF